MNVCRFRNHLANYCDYVISGDDRKILSDIETDLQSVVFWIIITIYVTVVMAWWIVPLRRLSDKIASIKFRCDRK